MGLDGGGFLCIKAEQFHQLSKVEQVSWRWRPGKVDLCVAEVKIRSLVSSLQCSHIDMFSALLIMHVDHARQCCDEM